MMAAGFVQLCYDGARSIANNGLRVTSLAELIQSLPQERITALGTTIRQAVPWADTVLLTPGNGKPGADRRPTAVIPEPRRSLVLALFYPP